MLEKLQQKKVLVFAMLVVVLALCIGSYAFFGLTPNDCAHDKEFIDNYNNAVHENGVAKLQDIAKSLSKKQVKSDATCLYIQMVIQYGDMKDSGELKTYQDLKDLEAKGQRVSSDINDGLNRQAMEAIIQQEIDDQARGVDASG